MENSRIRRRIFPPRPKPALRPPTEDQEARDKRRVAVILTTCFIAGLALATALGFYLIRL